jgi:hypothetical protein
MAGGAQPINLVTLAGGAAVERFDRELSRVLNNIADVNTDAEQVREITLKIKFKPTAEREHGLIAVRVGAESKLAAAKAHGTGIYMVRTVSGFSAVNADPRQPGFQFEGSGTSAPIIPEA